MKKNTKQEFLSLFKKIIEDAKVTKRELCQLEKWLSNLKPPLAPGDVLILMTSIMDHLRTQIANGKIQMDTDEAIRVVMRIWQKVWLLYSNGEIGMNPWAGCGNHTRVFFRERWVFFKQEVEAARQQLDIAVFDLAADRCRDLLNDLSKNGVKIRIVSEKATLNNKGSDIRFLAEKENIQVRIDNSKGFMHHKFVVIDDSKVLNGSMNFTGRGFSVNRENFLSSSHYEIVSVFKEEFERLWDRCHAL